MSINNCTGAGIQTIGIIGEGKMGTGIFYFLLDFPFTLRWIGSSSADLEKLKQSLGKKLNRSLKAGLIDQRTYENKLVRTVISNDLQLVADCDLVIEAVNEDLDLKKELFVQLDKSIPQASILASNSSSITPSRLFVSEPRNPYIIGLHYFYPVQLKNIVEVILTDRTSGEVRSRIEDFLSSTGKQYLLLNESTAFILNKLFLDVQNEAFRIVDQGVIGFGGMDRLVKETLFPFGVFDFMDSVGIDTMLASVLNYTSGYPHQDYFAALIAKLTSLTGTGKLGIKSGEGFYDYRESQPQQSKPDPDLPEKIRAEIAGHLKNTYLSAAKRFTMQSKCSIDEMNHAVKEYFGIEKGPFE
ncbi:MAG: 3-hydroxyacyl-CoA dehydrogenase family protein [bacterium]